jgi:pimeloyl-ACP methyl ester carboxylesterase
MRHFYPEKWDNKGSDFTSRQHAKDLIAFIESTGGPVYLVGWSYGGLAAYVVARTRPDLVKKLVLVEAFVEPDGQAGDAELLHMANATAKFFDAGNMDGGLQYAVDSLNKPGAWASLPEPVRQNFRDNAWSIVIAPREETDPVTCAEFGSLKMPVLLVTGQFKTPRHKQELLDQSKCLPGATVVTIAKAGHSVAAMNPPAFKQAVYSFLQH